MLMQGHNSDYLYTNQKVIIEGTRIYEHPSEKANRME